jgi:FHA domain
VRSTGDADPLGLLARFLGRPATSEEQRLLLAAQAHGSDLLWRRPPTGGRSPTPIRLPSNTAITIGSAATATVSLPDRRVSHHHVELRSDERRWYGHDMNSTAGTRVAQEPITGWHRIRHGDVLELSTRTALMLLQLNPPARTLHPAANFLPDGCLTPTDKRTLAALARPLRSDPHAQPASNRDIARELDISVEAVKDRVASLLRKAGLSGHGHRGRLAARGLLLPP